MPLWMRLQPGQRQRGLTPLHHYRLTLGPTPGQRQKGIPPLRPIQT